MNGKVLVLLAVIGGAFFFVKGGSLFTSGPAGGDPQTATAAVALTGGVMSPDESNPNPSPTPGPKPPRKDCKYCDGTGFITHGDGHRSPCPHCEAPKDDLFSKKQCCPHCECGKGCTCEYPGQCLVEANGGEPVKICDENGCHFYAPPDYSFSKAQPPVDDAVIAHLDSLVDNARAKYAAKDYVGTLVAVQELEKVLLPLPDNDTFAFYRKKALHARMNLDKKLTLIDKESYRKFVKDYADYMERTNKRLAELLEYKQKELKADSCESGSCDYNNQDFGGGLGPNWGSKSFMRYGEGRPAYSFESFAPQRFYGDGFDGESCSSCGR